MSAVVILYLREHEYDIQIDGAEEAEMLAKGVLDERSERGRGV